MNETCCVCGYEIHFPVEPGDPSEPSTQDMQSIKIGDKWICGTCKLEIKNK